jgi:hypothetical protein
MILTRFDVGAGDFDTDRVIVGRIIPFVTRTFPA